MFSNCVLHSGDDRLFNDSVCIEEMIGCDGLIQGSEGDDAVIIIFPSHALFH